jgi:tetratricopeptide (TPR) repeat protein
MGLWEKAAEAYRRALEIDGGDARTRDGLAAALLELDRPREAAEEALHAVWLSHDLASAHFHLGAALAGMGEQRRAIEAFETCLSLDERARGAHLWLARLYETGALDLVKALEHRARAQEIL